MKNIIRNTKLFILFSKLSLKSTLQARMGIIFFMIGKIARFFFFFFFIFLVFSQTKIIKGYNFNQAIIFYLTFNIIDTASQILFREVYRFRQQVVSGTFDLILMKPHHPFVRILLGGIDFLDLTLLIPYFIMTIYFILKIPTINFLIFILYFLLLINALIIATAFHIAVLALGILTTEVDHTIMIYRDLTTIGRFPLEIYKEPVRGIFTFIIPIGVMMSFPPYVLFRILSLPFFLYSFLISSILLIGALKLWDMALKKYQSWGG